MLHDRVAGWELAVSDTGRGLSEEQLAHLYEPFNRLGAERDGIEGRGIGLMTARQLVQSDGRAHAGAKPRRATAASSASGCPSRRRPSRRRCRRSRRREARRAPADTLSVLYVEDNAGQRDWWCASWSALRPSVTLHVAADGAQRHRAGAAAAPELVLVDMQLPDMDGHELLRGLRAAAAARARCVALSANAMPDAVAAGTRRRLRRLLDQADRHRAAFWPGWTGWPQALPLVIKATPPSPPQRTDDMDDRIRVTLEHGVADVRLVRADKMNALDDRHVRGACAAPASG